MWRLAVVHRVVVEPAVAVEIGQPRAVGEGIGPVERTGRRRLPGSGDSGRLRHLREGDARIRIRGAADRSLLYGADVSSWISSWIARAWQYEPEHNDSLHSHRSP